MTQVAWYLFASALILSAILVSTARFMTPLLNQHRHEFEAWASLLLKSPVQIDEVHVDWRGYIPEFSLGHVVTLDKNTHKPAFEIAEVKIGFRLFSSLWQKKIVLHDIILSGAHVTILQDEKGKFSIKDLPVQPENDYQSYQLVDILDWIFSQHYLALKEINIEFFPWKGEKRDISLKKIAFWSEDDEHKIHGQFTLHQEVPTEISSTIDWQGNIHDIAHVHGHAYFNLEGFSLPQWIEEAKRFVKISTGWQIKQGIGAADIWIEWSNLELQQAQSIFQWYDLDLYSEYEKKSYPIQRISGHVGWKKEGNKQIFAGDDLLIDFPDHFWPASTFYITLSADGAKVEKIKLLPKDRFAKQLSSSNMDLSHLLDQPIIDDETLSNKKYHLEEVRVGYLALEDVVPLLLANASLPQDFRKVLQDLKPAGSLENITVSWRGDLTNWHEISLSGTTRQLSFSSWHHFPGVTNLSGVGAWNGRTGNFRMDSASFALMLPNVFPRPLIFDHVGGYLAFKHDSEGAWWLKTRKINLTNNDLDVTAGFETIFPKKESSRIDLKAQFSIANAGHVSHYLPVPIMDKDLVDWLKAAFLSGEVKGGHAVVQGKFNDFPFESAPTHKGKQPRTSEKTGTFEIGGKVKDLEFHYAPGWPLIRQANGELIFSGRAMKVNVDTAFIMGVPLAKTKGFIADLGAEDPLLEIQGGVETDFARTLEFIHQSPLQESIGKDLESLRIEGPMSLELSLEVPLVHPVKTKVLGQVKTVASKLALPEWNVALDQLQGQFQFTEDTITSDNLQAKLWKEPVTLNLATTKGVSGTPTFVEAKLQGKLNIEHLQTFLNFPLSNFVSGNTRFNLLLKLYEGSTTNQLTLTSDLEGIALDLPEPLGKDAVSKRDFLLSLEVGKKENAAVQVKYGDLIQAQLNITETPGFRTIDVDSVPVKGRVRLAFPFDVKQPMEADLERMNLKVGNSATVSGINPANLPPLTINARSFSYGDKNLGSLTLVSIPKSNGLVIQKFNLASPDYEFNSHGEWSGSGSSQKSQLQGTIESKHVKRFLERLGWNMANLIVDKGKGNFDLQWKGAPYSFSLATMTGNVYFALEKGRIINLTRSNNNKMDIGRMLSLFSLQTIPRRLSGDFSDLFEQGYSFDFVKGEFALREGNAYTQKDIVVDGPVARVKASGRIGLLAEDFDLFLSVSPYVTESLPVVAGALTLNPFVGAAAWVVNKMVLSQEVSKAATYRYTVKGTWQNPVWQSASKK